MDGNPWIRCTIDVHIALPSFRVMAGPSGVGRVPPSLSRASRGRPRSMSQATALEVAEQLLVQYNLAIIAARAMGSTMRVRSAALC
jgi:hypothetical protein